MLNAENRPPQVLDRRVANALYVDSEARPSFSWGPVGIASYVAKKIWGGLWVGGSALLYPDRIVFQPNALNEGLHQSLTGQGTLLGQITSVEVKSGVLTRVIRLHTSSGLLSLRCFRADAFAAAIEEARRTRLPAGRK